MSKDCKYRIYEDDGRFYPQEEGKLWGWNYFIDDSWDCRISFFTIEEAKKYLNDSIAHQKWIKEYDARERIKKYHYDLTK